LVGDIDQFCLASRWMVQEYGSSAAIGIGKPPMLDYERIFSTIDYLIDSIPNRNWFPGVVFQISFDFLQKILSAISPRISIPANIILVANPPMLYKHKNMLAIIIVKRFDLKKPRGIIAPNRNL
jgi:hypothetical protein